MDIVSEQKHDLCLNPTPKILYLQKEEIIMKDQVPGQFQLPFCVRKGTHTHRDKCISSKSVKVDQKND